VRRLSVRIGDELTRELLEANQSTEAGVNAQRERVRLLRERLKDLDSSDVHNLRATADMLVKKSVWSIGGDGWAYDIGFGGLDHVVASGRNISLLVLDTEVYSNTGGQMSKSTPRGAVAKFAAAGKSAAKKDLALIAMSYGSACMARVAMGANDAHTPTVFREAEAFDRPPLILAYSHCIAQGYDTGHGLEQQKAAVLSGYWPPMRCNPALAKEGKNPFVLDSKAAAVAAEAVRLQRRPLHHARPRAPGRGPRAGPSGGTGRARPLAAV